MKLSIVVDFEDDSDFDFLRFKCVGSVEDTVQEFLDEERNDGRIDVSWDSGD